MYTKGIIVYNLQSLEFQMKMLILPQKIEQDIKLYELKESRLGKRLVAYSIYPAIVENIYEPILAEFNLVKF